MAQIQKKVITFTKRNQDGMAEETEIQHSLAVEDMKEYLEQVVREVKKNPTKHRNDPSNLHARQGKISQSEVTNYALCCEITGNDYIGRLCSKCGSTRWDSKEA